MFPRSVGAQTLESSKKKSTLNDIHLTSTFMAEQAVVGLQ